MFAQIQLAIALLGALACLVQLFGGLFDSSRDQFYAAPIALLALIPVVSKARTQATTIAAWSLATLFAVSYAYEHSSPTARINAFDILEWATLVIAMRAFYQRPQYLIPKRL